MTYLDRKRGDWEAGESIIKIFWPIALNDLKRYVDLKMIVWSGATFILTWSCMIGGNLNGILSFLRGTNGATLLEPKPVAGVSDGFLWAKTESCCCHQRCGGWTTTRLIAQPRISSEDFVMVIRDLSFYRTQVRPCLISSMLSCWLKEKQ